MVFFCVLSSSIHAAPLPISYTFHSNTECATEKNFESALHRYVTTIQPDDSTVYDVNIEEQGTVFRVELRVTENNRTFLRTVSVFDCNLSSKVAALLVALIIDPDALNAVEDTSILDALSSKSSQTSQNPTPPSSASTNDQSNAEKPQSPSNEHTKESQTPDINHSSPQISSVSALEKQESDKSNSLARRLGIGVATSFFFVPSTNLGPTLDLSFILRRFSVSARTGALFSQKQKIDSQSEAWFQLHAAMIEIGMGTLLGRSTFVVYPSVGISGYLLSARSGEMAVSVHNRTVVLGAYADVAFAYRFAKSWAVFLSPCLRMFFSDTRYTIENFGHIHSTGNAALFVQFGIFAFF